MATATSHEQPAEPADASATLILAGTDDRIVPVANADVLAWAIPNSRIQRFDDGHLFLITDPASSAAAIDEFLSAPDE